MFSGYEKCTWESIDILNKKLKELTELLTNIKEATPYMRAATDNKVNDDSILTQDLQQQHRKLLNMENPANDSYMLAPNHSILMETQSLSNGADWKTDFHEFSEKIFKRIDENSTSLENIETNLGGLVGRNPVITEIVASNANLSGDRPETDLNNSNVINLVGRNPATTERVVVFKKQKKQRMKDNKTTNLSGGRPETDLIDTTNGKWTNVISKRRKENKPMHDERFIEQRQNRRQLHSSYTTQNNHHMNSQIPQQRQQQQRHMSKQQNSMHEKDATKIKYIFWSRLKANFDTLKAKNYIIGKGIARHDEFTLTPLSNNSDNNSYISYKINITDTKYECLLDSSLWPTGSYVRKFYENADKKYRTRDKENKKRFF